VENEKQENEDDLVEELAPALHQKRTGDFPSTVKTVVPGRNLSRADSIFHTSCCSHGVLASDTDAIEEESPYVADDPAVLSDAPGSSEHEKTDKHDGGILDETEPATKPVTNNTNKNLTDNDTANLEVVDSLRPCFVADFVAVPAVWESGLE
jgi:hypothetical protein